MVWILLSFCMIWVIDISFINGLGFYSFFLWIWVVWFMEGLLMVWNIEGVFYMGFYYVNVMGFGLFYLVNVLFWFGWVKVLWMDEIVLVNFFFIF